MLTRIEKADWDIIHQLACDIVNASSINDDILCEIKRVCLFSALDDLEKKYGKHPSIIATKGDFSNDRSEALLFFKDALELARFHEDKVEEEEILDSIKGLDDN